jgi:hypothetical protein
MRLAKIISGGQTGVDRAGLDAAMEAGIPVGGYCSKGRLAEDGRVPDHYPLVELTKGGYPVRTEKNVVESDGTLILTVGEITGGTKFTLDCAKKHGKPYMVVHLDSEPKRGAVFYWIEMYDIKVMNVAGPRESKCPGVYDRAKDFLRFLFISE